jgi:hypothetical protein
MVFNAAENIGPARKGVERVAIWGSLTSLPGISVLLWISSCCLSTTRRISAMLLEIAEDADSRAWSHLNLNPGRPGDSGRKPTYYTEYR